MITGYINRVSLAFVSLASFPLSRTEETMNLLNSFKFSLIRKFDPEAVYTYFYEEFKKNYPRSFQVIVNKEFVFKKIINDNPYEFIKSFDPDNKFKIENVEFALGKLNSLVRSFVEEKRLAEINEPIIFMNKIFNILFYKLPNQILDSAAERPMTYLVTGVIIGGLFLFLNLYSGSGVDISNSGSIQSLDNSLQLTSQSVGVNSSLDLSTLVGRVDALEALQSSNFISSSLDNEFNSSTLEALRNNVNNHSIDLFTLASQVAQTDNRFSNLVSDVADIRADQLASFSFIKYLASDLAKIVGPNYSSILSSITTGLIGLDLTVVESAFESFKQIIEARNA